MERKLKIIINDYWYTVLIVKVSISVCLSSRIGQSIFLAFLINAFLVCKRFMIKTKLSYRDILHLCSNINPFPSWARVRGKWKRLTCQPWTMAAEVQCSLLSRVLIILTVKVQASLAESLTTKWYYSPVKQSCQIFIFFWKKWTFSGYC